MVGLDSNMDTVKYSTKGRFVSKIRRFLGREDAQRRGDSPNWSPSSSFPFVILWFRITIMCDSLFQQAISSNKYPIWFPRDPVSSILSLKNLFPWHFSICSFSKALVTDGDTIIFYNTYVLSSYFIRFVIGVSTNHTPKWLYMYLLPYYHNYTYDIQLNTWILIVTNLTYANPYYTHTHTHF